MMQEKSDGIAYNLIRSARKTISIEIRPDGGILCRAPQWASKREIDDFVLEHENWIKKHREIVREKQAQRKDVKKLTYEELMELGNRALGYIPKRVAYFAPLVGVDYGRITIRCQKTKWGSCSSKGNLNFNCLLMLAPPKVLDSIVVHELCHRLEMNHSKRFYEEVRRVFPDYDEQQAWLKENGSALMARVYG